MTKADKDFVELTAELAATKAVNKMRNDYCAGHSIDIAAMKTTVEDNEKHIGENRTHINNDRKIFLTGIGIIIIGEVVMKFIM